MPSETIASPDKDSLQPLVGSLLSKIDELLDQNKMRLARIAEFEAKLGTPPKTPTNSSLPPSRGQKANPDDASTGTRTTPRPVSLASRADCGSGSWDEDFNCASAAR